MNPVRFALTAQTVLMALVFSSWVFDLHFPYATLYGLGMLAGGFSVGWVMRNARLERGEGDE